MVLDLLLVTEGEAVIAGFVTRGQEPGNGAVGDRIYVGGRRGSYGRLLSIFIKVKNNPKYFAKTP